jgi:L-alanine-DL-glutamate epimerase-like enolase superfamily enzyme
MMSPCICSPPVPPQYLEAHGFGLERYIAEPLQIEDGYAIAPRRPGHGVEFDWRSLDRMKA